MRATHATWNARTFDIAIPGGGKKWRSDCFSCHVCHTMVLKNMMFSLCILGFKELKNTMFSSCILGFKELKNIMFSSWILGQKGWQNNKLFLVETKNHFSSFQKKHQQS